MAVEFDREEGIIRLEGIVDIRCAAELKRTLREAVSGGQPVRLRLEQLEEIDVTAMQLLVAAERAAAGRGWAVAGRVPEAIPAAMRAAGFARFPFTGAVADEVRRGA